MILLTDMCTRKKNLAINLFLSSFHNMISEKNQINSCSCYTVNTNILITLQQLLSFCDKVLESVIREDIAYRVVQVKYLLKQRKKFT